MKKILGIALLSAAALLAGCSRPRPVYVAPPPPVIAIHDQGVHDGFEAARKDVAENRPSSFEAHPKYRNPPVPAEAWRDYRNGFRDGYEQFLRHGAPPR